MKVGRHSSTAAIVRRSPPNVAWCTPDVVAGCEVVARCAVLCCASELQQLDSRQLREQVQRYRTTIQQVGLLGGTASLICIRCLDPQVQALPPLFMLLFEPVQVLWEVLIAI